MVQKIIISNTDDSLQLVPEKTRIKSIKPESEIPPVKTETNTENNSSDLTFTDEEKRLMFEYELGLIESKEVRSFTEKCLLDAPEYFWYVPASSTGKYHSKESNGVGGLINHVKMAVKVARDLLRIEQYSDLLEKKDYIYSALILHDIIKYGFEKGKWVLYEHPLLAQKYILMESQKEYNKVEDWVELIGKLVSTHSGQWNTNHEGKVILNKPETPEEKFVHLCDYLASRNYIG